MRRIVSLLLLAGLLGAVAGTDLQPTPATARDRVEALRIYNVREFGARGDDLNDDFFGIQGALDWAAAQGGGTVRVPAGTYRMTRCGLVIESSVSLVGDGRASVLKLNNSSSPCNSHIRVRSTFTATVYTFTGALTRSQRIFTLSSVAGLAVGDEVMLFLGSDPYDVGEEFLRIFNIVESITGSDITLRIGLPEAVAEATHELRKVDRIAENLTVANLAFDYVSGTTPDQTVVVQNARNVRLTNLFGVKHTGALVEVRESENIHADGLYSVRSDRTAHSTAGRMLAGWGFRNCSFRNIFAEDVDGATIFFESQVRGAVLDTLYLQAGSGTTANFNVIQVAGGSRGIVFRNVHFNSSVTRPSLRVVEESEVRFEDVYLWSGNKAFDLRYTSGFFYHDRTSRLYRDIKRWSKVFKVEANMVDVDVGLPAGIYKAVKVYAHSTAGISEFRIENISNQGWDIAPNLVAGVLHFVSANFSQVGLDWAFNTVEAKRTEISTSGAVPADAYAVIEIEYYTAGDDDHTTGLIEDRRAFFHVAALSGSGILGNNLRGAHTFSSSGTLSVGFPRAEPDTDYRVVATPNAQETIWVTAKATTGFTLNSHNAASTATVDWVLVR